MENETKGRRGGRRIAKKITVNSILRFVSLGLFLIGILFYLSWSILYGTWTDVGLYSFSVVTSVFGLLGMMLAREKERQAQQ